MRPPARLAPWLLIAFLTLGVRAVADPIPAPPASLDFPARAAALEAAGDPSSLVEAIALRRALGQPELAAGNTEHFFDRLAKEPQSAPAAAEAYLDELADPVLSPAPAAREASLRRFLALVSAPPAGPALLASRIRAEVLLADQLWDQSCPLPPEQRADAACVQRIDLRGSDSAFLTLLKRKIARNRRPVSESELHPCYEPPSFRYVVHPRRSGLAREAQTLLSRALGRARPKDPLSPQLTDALAQARFLLAEPRFEAALARTAPLGLVFDPNSPRRMREAKARFSSWLTARTNGSFMFPKPPREQPLYAAAEIGASAAWSLAAKTRLAQLLLDLDNQINHTPYIVRPPPPPSGLTVAEWRSLFLESYYCFSNESPWLDEAKKLLHACTAPGLTLDTPFVHSCHELLSRIDPVDPARTPEILHAPTVQTALLFRSGPGELAQ